MSEQLVLILLIATTLITVLIALVIPDDPSTELDHVAAYPNATIGASGEDTFAVDDGEPRSCDAAATEAEGAEPDDARRAVDIPEATGR